MYQVLFGDHDDMVSFFIEQYRMWDTEDFMVKDTVYDGNKALEKLENYTYDIAVLDIQLPSIGGLELMQFLQKRKKKIPIILTSTKADFEDARKGMILGAVDYIIKPFTEDKLKAALERARTRIEEERMMIKSQNHVTAYIARESLQDIYESVLGLEQSPDELAQKLLNQLEPMFPGRRQRLVFVVEQVLLEIWNQISRGFPWILKLEQLNIQLEEELLLRQTEAVIKQIQTIVHNYGLNHQNQLINKVCSLIVENLNHEKILDYISQEMELSKDYLGRLFRNKMKMTLNEYCTRIKMEYAGQLLQNTNQKIYEISESLGYLTPDYFTRLFKEHSGMTPMEYRKNAVSTEFYGKKTEL